ncbi:MAG: AI-2E family transporter [Pseudolabrys sp.]|jgi:predicted PurR-regulated permease PerM
MPANGLTVTDTHSLVKGVAAAVLAALIVATLYFGRDVFVPVALSILLSFVLAPLVHALQDFRVPRAISVIGVVLLAFSIIFVIGGVIATQMTQLAGELPRYESNMRAKIQSLRGTAAANNTLERAADVLQDLSKELNKPKEPSSARTAAPTANSLPGQDARPIPVEVRQPPPTALESIAALISPLLHPLMTSGIVIIFVIFTLLQREDLRNRLIKLAGSHDLQKTTVALNDAAERLSRLFLSQLALNSAFGLVIGTGLWFIGVPSAVLWGILAGILRFVPYIGVFIAAVFPLLLAVAVDPGWSMLLWSAALFVIVEPLVGQVIEPLLYGRSTGLSPLAVVVSATFWTALWGPIGLVLATPLTICLVVLGRHVENLKFLEVMFGDRPALSPSELFYQRMLADDPAEALDNAEQFLKERPLAAYYDEVALKGLKLAQADLDRNALDTLHLQRIRDSVIELVRELDDHEDQPQKRVTQDVEAAAAVDSIEDPRVYDFPILAKDKLTTHWRGEAPVLCIAGRTGLDEAVAVMLAQILSKQGIGTRLEGVDVLSSANILRLETKGIVMVCVSFLNTSSIAQMRFTIRRLRRKLPGVVIVLGSWNAEADSTVLADAVKADGVALTLHDAVKLCLEEASADAVGSKVEANNNDSRNEVDAARDARAVG